MMELDLAYVERKSLLLDLKIIVCTIPAILVQVWDTKTGRNAAAKTVPLESLGPELLQHQLPEAALLEDTECARSYAVTTP